MSRAYYSASVRSFLTENPLTILGELTDHHGFELEEPQKSAWKVQINLLKKTLVNNSGHIFFEFSIPRMGKRVDVILLEKGIVFVLEFKIGERNYPRYAIEQVMDYGLDLKNFHETSHQLPIIPVLVSTNASAFDYSLRRYPDGIYQPLKANAIMLANLLSECMRSVPHSQIDPIVWEAGQYKPTPTIIEAAQALYRGHNVQEISRSDAGAINLSKTSEAIDRIIEQTKNNQQKVICFITGVPGAGKTLAGLNIANRRLNMVPDENAVFLSGNGPLVSVLREALVRDDILKGVKRRDAARKAETFIQNIHHFRDEYINKKTVPLEQVVVFDEAQRAWTKEMTSRFMKKKRGLSDFDMSEPMFLIGVMDRHTNWAVIIRLIGGGQEINTGEAGLSEWFFTLQKHFPNWHVYISPKITDFEYLMDKRPDDILPTNQLSLDDDLHLAVSVRSYRTEKVSALIRAILDCDLEKATFLYTQVANKYPIVLTRDLRRAKDWLRQQARGSERFGLLASSGADRLQPEGIYVRAEIEVANWFLNDFQDVRSSYSLEGAATEFDVQGLELDWIAVAWDADFRFFDNKWEFKSFRGSKWQSVTDPTRQLYLKNSYRVLLTRARQGMVIFIPYGEESDNTRLPIFYDGTFSYLSKIGFRVL